MAALRHPILVARRKDGHDGGLNGPFLPPQPVDAKMKELTRRVKPRVLMCGLVRRPTELGMFRR